ncbi:hypothetical protein SAMN04487936_102559 [Halobacillus dabanensis]|uniref:Uncharacterized protein n=1 Tax=Halobacillus dabanensis TaxID=240302 RepID=A0A1I3SBF9_HALDA|nr:hypothetical protein [Halobacillus dabanensis]SFJ54846.1 hypothetical protein SAMN04487936_102559 [Halobacillus dabanensis]
MSKLLATLICGNLTAIIFAIYFTKDPNMFWINLYGIYYVVFLGLFLLAFPFSFLIEKMVRKLDIGRFFIKVGLYIFLGIIAMVLLFPIILHWSSMAIIVAIVFPFILHMVEKIPEKYKRMAVIIWVIFSIVLFALIYYRMG